MGWVLSLALVGGCGRPPGSAPAESPPLDAARSDSAPAACTPVDFPRDAPDAGDKRNTPEEHAATACDASLPVFESGREVSRVCPDDARRQGLTILDLSDDWVPLLLRDPDGEALPPQPYRATYVALANEEFPAGAEGDRARRDAFLELYGIFPSFRVLAARLLDEERHVCDAGIDQEPIQALTASLQPSSAARPTRPGAAALAALEQRLLCERLLAASARRHPRWLLQEALEAFQRKHMIVSRGFLDGETRRALAEDSRELDFRAVLRTLRARVVDATGLIEDGTALAARGAILSRRVDGDAFYASDEDEALEGGAPDLVSPATEAAARALGWTDPRGAAEFFRRGGPEATRRLTVAMRLPPVPGYHSEHMELRAEIDRGDVWYELPSRRGPVAHRPTLTLYAHTSDGDVALVRWPTTIGGWKKELGPGGRVGLRYKNSDVGKRLWRDLVASPAWLPPPKTPARALVRRGHGPAKWLPETDLVDPGYRSAYGLVMLVHHRFVQDADGGIWYDNGIRTHGSVNYHSILRSESHGCHRLFNHAAVQLASFLLHHRRHVPRGLVGKPFTHEFTWRGITLKVPIPHRGYWFELTPPVEVEVLTGTVRGRIHRVPQRIVSLPRPIPLAHAAGAAPAGMAPLPAPAAPPTVR